MKKLLPILLSIFLVALVAFTPVQAGTYKLWAANSLTGGGTGALDAIDGASLTDGDIAIVVVSKDVTRVYQLNASSGAAESSPEIISPDTNASNNRWILTTMDTDTAITVANGGTGASTLTDGGPLLGSGTGAITAMSVLADSEMIVGDGTTDPVAESGATLRTSVGVGTGDSPQLTAVNVGHASDTTVSRASAGDLNIEGNIAYRAGGTDVPATDGGTGASTLTDGGVLVGSGAGAVTPLAVGTNGQVLVGSTGADPVMATITDGEGITTTLGAGTLQIDTEDASTSNKGVLETATDAEATTGTATTKAVVPANLPVAISAYQKHLRNILYPVGIDYNDMYKSGWKPYWFNQQGTGFGWGGEYPNGAGTHFWTETGFIQDQFYVTVGEAAGNTWKAQGFQVGQGCTVNAVWLKLYKTGDPQKDAEPLVVYICPEAGGEPEEDNPLITFTTIDGHDLVTAENWPITSNSDGAWYKFAGDSAALSANTNYYIVVKGTGADAANHFQFKISGSGKATYSHGAYWSGDDATPANWAENTSYSFCFMIETAAATQLLQSSGQFNGKLVFSEGSPKNLSQFLVNDLKNMYSDEGDFSFNLTTSGAIPASSTLAEITMGDPGANRLRVFTDATPNVCVSLAESDGTVVSITDGATDVSGAANRTIMVRCRAKADGSDALELLLNGAAEGTQLSSGTYTLDDNFADQACFILGGGFAAESTWDKDFKTDQLAGGNLPSNDANTTFTTTTAATEASCYTVQNSKLYQNYAYYNTGNEDGYYLIALAGMADATGFALLTKQQILKCVNTAGEQADRSLIAGDTNYEYIHFHEYYIETYDFKYQIDTMSKSNLYQLCAKGDDSFVFINGKLAVDGTGLFSNAAGLQQMWVGDNDTTAGSDADVIYEEILCYDAGPLLPSAADGLVVDEFAFWSADMTDIAVLLYNAGTPVSVKEVCGLDKNYVENIRFEKTNRNTASPTNTGTAALLTDAEMFTLTPASNIEIHTIGSLGQNTDQKWVRLNHKVDGAYVVGDGNQVRYVSAVAGAAIGASLETYKKVLCGLHKVETWWNSEDATSSAWSYQMNVKEK